MRTSVFKNIFDVFVIVIVLTYQLSMLTVWTVDMCFGNLYEICIAIFMFASFIFRFGLQKIKLPHIENLYLLRFLFIIYIVDIIQNIIQFHATAFPRFMVLITIYFFANYLLRLALENTNQINIKTVVKPYMYYSLYNVFTVIIAAILIVVGILNPFSNSVSDNSLLSNHTIHGYSHFFPGYLTMSSQIYRVVPEIPVLTGLSHEPHVLCFLIMPALFFAQLFIKKNYQRGIIYVLFGVLSVISMSTTAILILIPLIVYESIWRIVISKKYSTIIIVLLTVFLMFNYGSSLINMVSAEVKTKTVDNTESKEVSEGLLEYVYSPVSLIGDGNLRTQEVGGNIGLVTCLLDVFFYFLLLFKAVKLSISSDYIVHYCGMGALYFSLHSLKIGYMIFRYPYLSFMVILIYLACERRNLIKYKLAQSLH